MIFVFTDEDARVLGFVAGEKGDTNFMYRFNKARIALDKVLDKTYYLYVVDANEEGARMKDIGNDSLHFTTHLQSLYLSFSNKYIKSQFEYVYMTEGRYIDS